MDNLKPTNFLKLALTVVQKGALLVAATPKKKADPARGRKLNKFDEGDNIQSFNHDCLLLDILNKMLPELLEAESNFELKGALSIKFSLTFFFPQYCKKSPMAVLTSQKRFPMTKDIRLICIRLQFINSKLDQLDTVICDYQYTNHFFFFILVEAACKKTC